MEVANEEDDDDDTRRSSCIAPTERPGRRTFGTVEKADAKPWLPDVDDGLSTTPINNNSPSKSREDVILLLFAEIFIIIVVVVTNIAVQ